MELYFKRMQTPAGEITIFANDRAVTGLFLGKHNKKSLGRRFESAWEKDNDVLLRAARQLKSYFAGSRKNFSVPVKVSGTVFQKSVWQALRRIGYGKLASYAAVAKKIGNPKACRAVGGAISSNPVSIIIPCHRVIGSDDTLTGFGGGLPTKRRLLETEGHHIRNFKIDRSRNLRD
jgi:methylated-DNA-[protein]-cysteine S-methyltransferase